MTWPNMQAQIQAVIDGADHRVGVCVIDPRTRSKIVMGDHGMFRTASTNKMAALVQFLQDAAQGLLNLNQKVRVTEADYPSGGSPMRDQGLLPGDFTLIDLAERMIVDSDNTATNVIMSLVGRDRIRSMLTGLGIDPRMVTLTAYTGAGDAATWHGSGWEGDRDAYYGSPMCTAEALADLLLIIHDGAALEPAYQHAVTIMTGTKDSTRLRGGLVRGTPLAHKAGSLSGNYEPIPTYEAWPDGGTRILPFPGISNDAGILQLDGHQYVIAVMTEGSNQAPGSVGSAIVATVSQLVFNGLVGGQGANPVTAIYTDRGRTLLR